MTGKKQVFRILLVDIEAEELERFRGVKSEVYDIRLEVFTSGEARKYLLHACHADKSLLPKYILLGFRVEKDPYSFIEDVKNHDEMKMIPLNVLIDSKDDPEINPLYEAGVNCCIKKTGDASLMKEVIQYMYDFWINVVEYPKF